MAAGGGRMPPPARPPSRADGDERVAQSGAAPARQAAAERGKGLPLPTAPSPGRKRFVLDIEGHRRRGEAAPPSCEPATGWPSRWTRRASTPSGFHLPGSRGKGALPAAPSLVPGGEAPRRDMGPAPLGQSGPSLIKSAKECKKNSVRSRPAIGLSTNRACGDADISSCRIWLNLFLARNTSSRGSTKRSTWCSGGSRGAQPAACSGLNLR
jgi:hypothetical protein